MRAPAFTFVLALSLVGLSGTVGLADGFSFSIGHHGHGHGHHHYHPRHCWEPSYSFGYWAPPPPRYVYVAPPPVIQERIYVQPPVQERVIVQQQAPISNVYESSGSNVASNRLPAPPTRAASTGAPVLIRNTNGKNVPVAFLVDDKSEELRDGQTRSFSGSSHIVEFDRGGNLGTARYELTSGLYAFTVGDNGWELVKDSNSSRTADRPALKKNELPVSVSR